MRCAMLGSALQRAQAYAPAQAPSSRRRPAAAARRQPARAFFSRGGGAPQQPGGDSGAPAATNNSAQETMVSDGAIKSLSPEARRIFREAQDNIIELNKSRLRALDELKAARQKIAELESKLEAAVAEASSATAQLQQLGPASSQRAAQAAAAGQAYSYGQQQAPPAQPAVQYQPPQQQYQRPQSAPPAAQQPSPDAGASITIVYETGWNNAHLHYNADGQGWTSAPGAKMENGNQQFPDKKVLTVPGRRLEFVINDGGNDWDKPSPWGSSKLSNYVVEEPGVYRLRNGKVTRLA